MQQHPGLHDMAIHQPQLIDFSAPPNVMPAMEAPPPAFDSDGLLALHADDMPAAGDTAPPWPQASVSLSLFNNYSTAGAYHHQPFTAAVSVAPDHQLQVPAAAASLQPPFQLIRSSKYLGPVKELLSEFCNLEGDFRAMVDRQIRAPLNKAAGDKWDDDVDALSSGLWGSPSLSSMDLLDLERRKARLLYMVEEVGAQYWCSKLVNYSIIQACMISFFSPFRISFTYAYACSNPALLLFSAIFMNYMHLHAVVLSSFSLLSKKEQLAWGNSYFTMHGDLFLLLATFEVGS
jgi:hypothetical protein